MPLAKSREFNTMLTMTHPEYQLFDNEAECTVNETLTPIYPSTQGLTQTRLRQLILIALKKLANMNWPA